MVTLVVFFIVFVQRRQGLRQSRRDAARTDALVRGDTWPGARARCAFRTPCRSCSPRSEVAAPISVIMRSSASTLAEHKTAWARRSPARRRLEQRRSAGPTSLGGCLRRSAVLRRAPISWNTSWCRGSGAGEPGDNKPSTQEGRTWKRNECSKRSPHCASCHSSSPRAVATRSPVDATTRSGASRLRRGVPRLHQVGATAATPSYGGSRARTGLAVDVSKCTRRPDAKVKLQLQWFAQAQFAGYYAAVDQGFYKDAVPRRRDPRRRRRHRPADSPWPTAHADFAIAWVPKALASREAGANIIDIAQVFQRSWHVAGELQGQEHHRRRPTSKARRSATGASATSTRSSPR